MSPEIPQQKFPWSLQIKLGKKNHFWLKLNSLVILRYVQSMRQLNRCYRICKESTRNLSQVWKRCVINLRNKSLSLGEDTPATSSLVRRTRESTDTNGMAPRACLRSLNFILAEFMVAILQCTFKTGCSSLFLAVLTQ